MRIHFYTDSTYASVDVYSPDGKKVILMNATSATTVYVHFVVKKINGTSITHSAGGELWVANNNSCGKTDSYNNIHITKVEGWSF